MGGLPKATAPLEIEDIPLFAFAEFLAVRLFLVSFFAGKDTVHGSKFCEVREVHEFAFVSQPANFPGNQENCPGWEFPSSGTFERGARDKTAPGNYAGDDPSGYFAPQMAA